MASLDVPDPRFECSYRAAMKEFLDEGRVEELRSLPDHLTFASFVAELHEQSEGRALPAGWVPGTTFWLVDAVADDADDDADQAAFIGKVEIRHRLTDALRLRGGHVGYSIRPTMRRRGFGTLALALALPECLALGLDRILVTCDADNDASQRIIVRNGGEIEDVVQLPDRATPTMRFRIDVARQCRFAV